MADAAKKFIQEVWGLQGTAYAVVGLRYYSRITTLGWQKLAWDDAIMLAAVLVHTAESVMAYLVVAYWEGLANNAMTDAQRAALDPNSEEYTLRVNGSKTHVAGLLLYTTLLWLLKLCWTVYYSRLTAGVNKMRKVILGAYVIMPVTYVSCLLVAFLKCIPFDHQWQINPDPGNHCMPAISTLQTVYVMVMNTVTDFYLMAIPIPMVWQSNLPLRKKIVLLVMFSGGFLEMAFGILRCVSILTLGDIDPAQSGYWSVRESFVSIVLTNMPMVYPLVRNFFEKSLSNLSGGSKNNTNNGDSHGYRLGSNPGRSKTNSKHPLSVPNDTYWGGSEENIVENGDSKTTASTRSESGGEDDSSSLPLPVHGPKANVVQSESHVSAVGSPPRDMVKKQHSGTRGNSSANKIVVTHEYTVTEDIGHLAEERGKGSGRRERGGTGYAY